MAALSIVNIACIGSELAVAWSDEVETYLNLEELRRACPCAKCQGEPDATGMVVRPEVSYGSSAFDLVRWEIVGGYAVQLFWKDGHNTGIYSYDYMRQLG